MNRLAEQFEKHHLFRRMMLIFVMVMVWRVTEWSFGYAWAADGGGSDVALVIAALTAPVTALMGYAAKLYTDSRGG